MTSKTALLKELTNEISEIINYKENNNNHWGWGDRKYSRARFRRLRLTIEEVLKDIEKRM